MVLGIDAFNIRAGGCVTHLYEILRSVNPEIYGFRKVVIWGNSSVLNKIESRGWLTKIHVESLDRSLPYRIYWHIFRAGRAVKQSACDVLYVPGGAIVNAYSPIVTMSRNMLPFDMNEIGNYNSLSAKIRLLLIRYFQSNSLRRAQGVIFLTDYARASILEIIGHPRGQVKTIPHGVSNRFRMRPRIQRRIEDCSETSPFRVLYVSALYSYKHQWTVAEAISKLRNEGIPIALDLIGPLAEGRERLIDTLRKVDPFQKFVKYHGEVPYSKLAVYYKRADIGLFASSCENMPNILLENMAAGLAIACSSLQPMPEILGKSGVYFDPYDAESIAITVRSLVNNVDLRADYSTMAYSRSGCFSWEKCADETFQFLSAIACSANAMGSYR